MQLGGNPPPPPPPASDRSHICCRCAVTHHHCVPFQARLLLCVCVYLCVVHSPINPVMLWQGGINQCHHMQEAETSAHAARIMMERIKNKEKMKKKKKKGRKKKKSASASWTNAPAEHVTRWTEEGSFSPFCRRAAFTGSRFLI